MSGVLQPVNEQIYFCSNPENFGDGTQFLKLRTNRPTWWIDSSPAWLPQARLEEIFAAGVNRWSKVADVYATRAASREAAHWLVKAANIDGPGLVLANAQLPNPTLRQQVVNLDIAEHALLDCLADILGHEGGHLYGLQHFPSAPPPEWMEPTLGVVNTPQAAEAALMVQLYGLPLPSTPGPGVPALPAVICTCRTEVVNGIAKVAASVQYGTQKAELAGEKALS